MPIHHSNVMCAICGERHAADHLGECHEALIGLVERLEDEIADLKKTTQQVTPQVPRKLVAELRKVRDALADQPIEALGRAPNTPTRKWWYVRDVLIEDINAALQEGDDEREQPDDWCVKDNLP